MNPLRIHVLSLLFLAGACLGAARGQSPDVRFADFESETYGGWTTEGTSFGPGPASGTLPNQMHVSGFQGKRLASSFHGGDGTVGTLTSPPFKVERRYVSFLIGGGAFEGSTCVNLIVDGKVVRATTGPNSASGGSEALVPAAWDVAEFQGKTAKIQAVDKAKGGWGHVALDEIVFTDAKPAGLTANLSREIVAERRLLLLPVQGGSPKRNVTVSVDGKPERVFEIELADDKPEWWAALDVSAWKGKTLTIAVPRVPEDSRCLAQILSSDELPASLALYDEPLRPGFHFSAKRGWLNDPNGLVFYDGTYHLFFQHNPYGWNWGNMHWGHATSRDLVRWEETGEALYPDKFGPMFSGSGVVDWKNTSGFGRDGKPPLLFFYTAAGSPTVQCLAYSVDGGKTLHKYEKNPIVDQFTPGNRDPKVIFHEPTGRWVMTLYVEAPKTKPSDPTKHLIRFLTSTDAKTWKVESDVEGFFECPDFFELPVEGSPGKSLWVLTAASSEYMLGRFDGKTFTSETGKLPGHRGAGYYAAQTYSDIPAADGRRIQIGWLQAPSPGMSFNQCMSIPARLTLLSTPDGVRLAHEPVKELETLREASRVEETFGLESGDAKTFDAIQGELLEVRAAFAPAEAAVVRFEIRGVPVVFDVAAKTIEVAGKKAPAPTRDGKLAFTAYVDRTSVEVFTDGGLTYVPVPVLPKADARSVSIRTDKGGTKVESLAIHRLKSSWGR